MIHTMPNLPYSTDAFPGILSRESFDYHYGKHFQAYVDNLNKMIVGTPFEDMPLEEIIVKADGGIFNNAAQAWNHALFFETLTPLRKEMPRNLKTALEKDFGSVEEFSAKMQTAATGLFGSGWAWLSADAQGHLTISAQSNAGNPMTEGLRPILAVDVWEHAYYIDYRNARASFVKALWDIIDWEKVASRL